MPATVRSQSAVPSASAILPLVLVFLCGIAVGAMLMRAWHHSHRPAASLYALDNKGTLERWKRELNLTPEQTARIESLLDDFSKYYDNVLADGNTRILQVLDDKQKLTFQRIIKERKQ